MAHHFCPVEGCHYGEDNGKGFAAVRSHINATGDPDHAWSDLKEQVDQQADDQDDHDDEGDEGDEGASSDGDEVGRQWSAQASSTSEGGKGADGDDDGDQDDTSGQGGLPVPVSPRLVLAVAVGLAAIVLVVRLRADTTSDEGPVEAPDNGAASTDESDAPGDEEIALIQDGDD